MKVLEEKPFGVEKTCACGSRPLIEEGDVRYGDFGSAAFDTTEYSYYATCPVCGRDIKLKFNEVPPRVEMAAKNRRQ